MNWTFQHSLVVLAVVSSLLAIVILLQQRRTPQSAVAWLLSFILVPYLAIPLFLMLGFRKTRRRIRPIAFAGHAGGVIPESARIFSALGAPPVWGGNGFTLHPTAAVSEAALFDVIASARDRLDIAFFILNDDETGRRFVRSLTIRAGEGIAVRIILDRLGTWNRPRAELADLERAGATVRFSAPFLNSPNKGHLNLRNHRKLVMADGATVWAGGRNVGDEYLAAQPGTWTDLTFVASGPVAQTFDDVFESDWRMGATGKPPEAQELPDARGDAVLQLVPAGPDEPSDILHDGLVNLIHRAERRVWIVTPYFVPTEPLQLALATAARRGVTVRIVVPDVSNKRSADYARGAYLRELARAGAAIERFTAGMIHAKCGLVDDVAWVGSANFDVRSLLLNFELALFAYDEPSVAQVETWIDGLTPRLVAGPSPASALRRVAEGLFRLSAPVL